jgi:hypothetical protein
MQAMKEEARQLLHKSGAEVVTHNEYERRSALQNLKKERETAQESQSCERYDFELGQ